MTEFSIGVIAGLMIALVLVVIVGVLGKTWDVAAIGVFVAIISSYFSGRYRVI